MRSIHTQCNSVQRRMERFAEVSEELQSQLLIAPPQITLPQAAEL